MPRPDIWRCNIKQLPYQPVVKFQIAENIPRGLKPVISYQAFAARLKSCPFKTRLSPRAVNSNVGVEGLPCASSIREVESGRRQGHPCRPATPPDGPFGIRRFLSTGQNLICDSELGFVRCVAWRLVGTFDLLRDFRPLIYNRWLPCFHGTSAQPAQRAHVTVRS